MKLKQVLTFAAIAFVATLQIAAPSSGATIDLGECTPEKMATAPSGSICRTRYGGTTWKVEDEVYANKRVYHDLTYDLKVTEPLDGTSDYSHANSFCTNGYRLPTGSIEDLDLSDFGALGIDGLMLVVPGMKDHLFWSATEADPEGPSAYVLDGHYDAPFSPTIERKNIRYSGAKVVCVSDGPNRLSNFFERYYRDHPASNQPAVQPIPIVAPPAQPHPAANTYYCECRAKQEHTAPLRWETGYVIIYVTVGSDGTRHEIQLEDNYYATGESCLLMMRENSYCRN